MALGSKKSVVVDNVAVVYDSYGSDDRTADQGALVFVHGWTCSSSLWQSQLPLMKKFRSIAIDLPGHGRSQAPQIEYSMEVFANAIGAVLKAEKITGAVLVGHSMGGPVSTMTLRLYPDLVSAVVYVDSFFHLPETYRTHAQRESLREALADDATFRSAVESLHCPATSEEVRKQVDEVVLSTARHVRCNATTTRVQPHAWRWDEVHQIPAVLFVVPMFENIDQAWLHHIPKLEVQKWKENGHFLFMEDPDRFNREVESFLQNNGLLQDVKSRI